MTLVKKRVHQNVSYDMTGNTGTLVYMAPEVALRKPYTEKVDIYSFGVILWQLTSGEVPFATMKKDEYMARVVHNGYRLKVGSHVPSQLSDLIQSCWDVNPAKRPSCEEILFVLDTLVEMYRRQSRRPSFLRSLNQKSSKGSDAPTSSRKTSTKTLPPVNQTTANTSSNLAHVYYGK